MAVSRSRSCAESSASRRVRELCSGHGHGGRDAVHEVETRDTMHEVGTLSIEVGSLKFEQ